MSLGATVTAEQPASHSTGDVRVMVVDDSAVVRGLISRWLREMPGIDVVASHRNGRLAVKDVLASDPDVILLDVEMPEMDGLTALPELLKAKPDVKIIMVSTLTERNAEISLRALSLGAADYLPKPDSNRGVTTSEGFRRELCDKVVAFGRPAGAETASVRSDPAQPAAAPIAPASADFSLRRANRVVPRIVVIGSSTGGPQALFEVTKAFGDAIDGVPVVITQHMPPTFTTILSEHISKSCGRECSEAEDGEPIVPGRILVAPGGKHLVLSEADGSVRAKLEDGPPINFCKPAVDPMFQSAAKIYGNAAFGIILTGMGHDGCEGARAIADAGGNVIAQDQETSVIWGMPGAAAAAGVCCAVLPLPQIGPRVARALSGVL